MKDKFLTTGSVLTALLSSLCCIGPLVLVGLGIGSTALFLEFNSLRPYLIGLALIFLTPAIYFTYKKREIKCEDGSCKFQSANKWNKIVVWFAAFAVLFFISFPYFGFDASAANNDNKQYENFKSVNLKIYNMDCEACARGLESQLKKIDGVKEAKINFVEKDGTIDFDSSKVNKENLIQLLEAEGFPAKIY